MMEIREGDVFRWSYKHREGVAHSYWAKSCIAIAKNGRLVDTYWHDDSGVTWTYEHAIEVLDLRLLGNLNDFENRQVDPAYYKAEDIMDLNHSNSSRGNLYVRKGAEHDREAMLAECKRRIEDAEGKIRSATHSLESLRACQAKLEAGETLKWLW